MTKEKKCLITQEIVGATRWMLEAPSSIIKPEQGGDGTKTWKDKALEDLKNKLNRVKGDFPEEAKQGVEFEKRVYEVASKREIKEGSELFQQVCKSVQGYAFYQKKGIPLEVEGEQCYLYCKFDAIHEIFQIVKDIKTTKKYSNGKYLKGFQHKLYCYVANAKEFEYIIAVWNQFPKLRSIHTEKYTPPERSLLENEIKREISETFSILKELNLWEVYRNTYCLY